MLRDAVNEIRLHPGRFVATLLAVALSVGFLVAVSVFVETEKQATVNSRTPVTSQADLVLQDKSGIESAEITKRLLAQGGVVAAQPLRNFYGFLREDAGANDDYSAFIEIWGTPTEEFRWSKLAEGKWPRKPGEIALAKDVVEKLKLEVGDSLEVLLDQEKTLKLVGITDDPKNSFNGIGYVAPDLDYLSRDSWLIKTNGDPEEVKAGLVKEFPVGEFEVLTPEELKEKNLKAYTGDYKPFQYVLWGFGGIAFLAGMVTISNTFTILVAQRRRQLGLLRAVGASSSQVLGRLLAEATLLGLMGSLLGLLLGGLVAVGGCAYTGTLTWGLGLPVLELVVAVLLGVLATLVAVIMPAFSATRIPPLAALQVVPEVAVQKRAGIARSVVCGLLFLLGGGLVWLSFQELYRPEIGLLWAVVGSLLLAAAVLFSTPLWVAGMIGMLGKLLQWSGPTTRLAVKNATRNPKRAGATAAALMFTVGLIITLQVVLASFRATIGNELQARYAIDITVAGTSSELAGLKEAVSDMQQVTGVAEIRQRELEDYNVVADGEAAFKTLGEAKEFEDDKFYCNRAFCSGGERTVSGKSGLVTLPLVPVRWVPEGMLLMSSATFDKIAPSEQKPGGQKFDAMYWISLNPNANIGEAGAVIDKIQQLSSSAFVGGNYAESAVLQKITDSLALIVTSLMGVAILISLVGVGNTLGLSVIERRRESALLRSLGMQRSGLRRMLLVESLLLVTVSVIVGVCAGVFFGWLGISRAYSILTEPETVLQLAIDWRWTLGLLLVCMAAAVLASLIPGRKAANVTPTEALAVE